MELYLVQIVHLFYLLDAWRLNSRHARDRNPGHLDINMRPNKIHKSHTTVHPYISTNYAPVQMSHVLWQQET